MTNPSSLVDILPPQTLAAWDWGRFGIGLLVVLFGAVCVLLVLAILIQKPQGGGLSGAFGAGASGSGQTAFGTKTGDALTWMTIIIFIAYLGAAIGMNYAMKPAGPSTTTPAASAPPAEGTGATPPATPNPQPAAPAPAAPTPAPTQPESAVPPATSTTTVKPAPAPTTPPATPPAEPATPPTPAPAPANPPAPR
ncbi:MAG TPA: preprotein translocase subunit SecG [Phycisphaerales bacterium]|nr:preprotein translocase subunit SecG [Phycisphaerales bacterium]